MLKEENQRNLKEVVNMGFTNSAFVTYTSISPNRNSPRTEDKITKITIHHTAGVVSLEGFDGIVSKPTREMSANYCVDKDGRIGLFCPESDRSWCTSSAWNDNRAVTIEVSNDVNKEPWSIGTKTYNALIKLVVDICKRNGITKLYYDGKNGTLTRHCDFVATQCPGTWIKEHTDQICNEVNAALNQNESKKEATSSSEKKIKDINTIVNEVIAGKWGNGEERKKKLTEAGYNYDEVQALVTKKVLEITAEKKKSINYDAIAKEIIAGKWGNGDERKKKLEAAGIDYNKAQSIVNKMVAESKKTIDYDKIARDVIAGVYGNGEERKKKLAAEGIDYGTVQEKVNALLKSNGASSATFSKRVAPAASFDSKYSGTYIVTAENLNVRYRPGLLTDENIVKILRKGSEVQCYGYYTAISGVRWYYVAMGAQTGYVCGTYVRKK